jgi:hypothetical protein
MRNFSKIFSVILLAAVIISPGSSIFAATVGAADSPSLKVSDISGKAGEDISVTVSIDSNPGIAGYTIIMTYNPNNLEYIGGNNNETIGAGGILPILIVNDDPANSRIVILAARATNAKQSGLLFTLAFRIKSENLSDGDLNLSYEADSGIRNADGEVVNPAVIQSVMNNAGNSSGENDNENDNDKGTPTDIADDADSQEKEDEPEKTDPDKFVPPANPTGTETTDGTDDNGDEDNKSIVEVETKPEPEKDDGSKSSSAYIPISQFYPSYSTDNSTVTSEMPDIQVKSDLSRYTLPANIAGLIPNFSNYSGVAGIKVTISDNSAKYKKITGTLSGIVSFKLELLDESGAVIAEITDFSDKIERIIPIAANIKKPEYWGVWTRENPESEWGFVPAKWTDKGVSVLSGTNSEYTVAEYTPKFTDVAKNKWYYASVNTAASKLLVRGINTEGTVYSPENQVTRAEFITMTVRALRLPEVKSNSGFKSAYTDIKAADWFYRDIIKAESAGLLTLLGSNEIKPNQSINREEMAYVLAKCAEYCKVTADSKIDLKTRFEDFATIDGKYIQYAEQTVSLKLMQGMSAVSFSGKGMVTRAQAAEVLVNMCKIFDWID